MAILTYHSIDKSDSVVSVTPETFESHIRYIKENGYETLPLTNLIETVREDITILEKFVVITFDDGYKNNYSHAFPILKKYGFKAIIFLTTNHLGKINNWPKQHSSIPRLPMLSWREIEEMSEYGIEFGGHTRSHPRLSELEEKEARDEILGSKMDIETHLGQAVEVFSYPFGIFNKRTKEIVRTAFNAAISNRPGKVGANSDIYALERINATSQLFRALPRRILFLRSFDLYLILKRIIDNLGNRRKGRSKGLGEM